VRCHASVGPYARKERVVAGVAGVVAHEKVVKTRWSIKGQDCHTENTTHCLRNIVRVLTVLPDSSGTVYTRREGFCGDCCCCCTRKCGERALLSSLLQDYHAEIIAHCLCNIVRVLNALPDINGTVYTQREGCCGGCWCWCTRNGGFLRLTCLAHD
jgi:hypothetical protein